MSGVNPQGCHVTPFKKPSPEEMEHDYLWRIHKAVPEYGDIGIFNRSHYEDVLVVRVHDLVPKDVWSKRYDQINEFEKIAAPEQREDPEIFPAHQQGRAEKALSAAHRRSRPPLEDFARPISPSGNSGTTTRGRTKTRSTKCSTPHAPWFVIPANKKWFRNLAVSHIITETLEEHGHEIPRAHGRYQEIEMEVKERQ